MRRLSRRELVKMGLLAGGTAMLPLRPPEAAFDDDDDDDSSDDDSSDDDRDGGGSPTVEPFQREMPIPEVHQSVATFSAPNPPGPTCSVPELPGFDLEEPLLYEVRLQKGEQEIVPGFMSEIWGYTGNSGASVFPGPSFMVERNQPIIVRFINDLSVEASTHNHGGHTPPGSDGFPNDFIFPGEFKDYYYPNITPDDEDSDFATFQWYHDHAMDITGENVYMGLAGFYLLTDDVEKDLIMSGTLPQPEFDIPMVLQDRRFDSMGQLIYDPMDHDGVIGDRFVVNGVIQPRFHVQRRKYRFRILNGSNARIYALKLSTRDRFLQIGNDSWMLPQAVAVPHLLLAPAERADVVIDFTHAPDEVFLTNHLTHGLDDGRGPDEDIDRPEKWPSNGTPLVKFIVEGVQQNNATVAPGTALRPHTPIHRDEIVRTRRFEFERSHGAWVINERFFDPDRDDATPKIGTAERWILENSSGGWVHPIHIHLEAYQIQRIDGRPPPPHMAAKKDTVLLGDFDAEVFMKFRTFPGRFVFHCHNVEHEDMRMMGVFNVKDA